MIRYCLSKKSRIVLVGLFCCCAPIFAVAASDGAMPGAFSVTDIIILLVLAVVLVLFAMNLRDSRMKGDIKSKEASVVNNALGVYELEIKQKDRQIDELKRSLEAEEDKARKESEELSKQCAELSGLYAEQEKAISTLSGNKRELEQLLVAKIKENDVFQREITQAAMEAEKQIQEAEQMHDNFFIETIHEMRTPLSLVLGSLSMIVQASEDDKDHSNQLLSAYRNTLVLQDLTDQLVGTCRSNDISSYLRVARYDMIDITGQICDLFVDWLAMNNVDFSVKAQTKKLWLWLDRRKIEYSLRTLLANSLKNTFKYGKITIDISVVRQDNKAYCSLAVSDEGLDEVQSTRAGLKQIKDTLDDIGGSLLNQADDSGTTYTLLIPLGKSHLMDRRVEFVEPEADLVRLNDRQKEAIAELIQVTPRPRRVVGNKLLIIDDSDQIRWFLKQMFGKEYQIFEARNGEEGVRMAFENEPDIILCDVMMPVKDGFTACREIKSDSRTSQVPVVMLTAKVESEDVVKGIEAGADDYITKPFDVEILHSKINNILRRRDQLKRYYTHSLMINETGVENDDEPSIGAVFMESVIKNIEKHLDDSTFEAKVLADSLNMSLPTLYRKIKQYSDCSILELTRTLRLKKAAELILKQKYSIQEVSDMVGFNDTATFRKRFAEQFGVTPSQYGQPQTVSVSNA